MIIIVQVVEDDPSHLHLLEGIKLVYRLRHRIRFMNDCRIQLSLLCVNKHVLFRPCLQIAVFCFVSNMKVRKRMVGSGMDGGRMWLCECVPLIIFVVIT